MAAAECSREFYMSNNNNTGSALSRKKRKRSTAKCLEIAGRQFNSKSSVLSYLKDTILAAASAKDGIVSQEHHEFILQLLRLHHPSYRRTVHSSASELSASTAVDQVVFERKSTKQRIIKVKHKNKKTYTFDLCHLFDAVDPKKKIVYDLLSTATVKVRLRHLQECDDKQRACAVTGVRLPCGRQAVCVHAIGTPSVAKLIDDWFVYMDFEWDLLEVSRTTEGKIYWFDDEDVEVAWLTYYTDNAKLRIISMTQWEHEGKPVA